MTPDQERDIIKQQVELGIEGLDISSLPPETQLVLLALECEILAQKTQDLPLSCVKSAQIALSYALKARALRKKVQDIRLTMIEPYNKKREAVDKLTHNVIKGFEDMEYKISKRVGEWVIETCPGSDLLSSEGTMFTKNIFGYEIIDENKIPREYLEPDRCAINEAIKAGVRNIDGLRIEEKPMYYMRLKNDK